ncbi:hypothetical protein LTR17_014717 [Elasticomyces elasticus]|nr:hypothetical protein LTR17_014717 [Elasticomyces elasticus]
MAWLYLKEQHKCFKLVYKRLRKQEAHGPEEREPRACQDALYLELDPSSTEVENDPASVGKSIEKLLDQVQRKPLVRRNRSLVYVYMGSGREDGSEHEASNKMCGVDYDRESEEYQDFAVARTKAKFGKEKDAGVSEKAKSEKSAKDEIDASGLSCSLSANSGGPSTVSGWLKPQTGIVRRRTTGMAKHVTRKSEDGGDEATGSPYLEKDPSLEGDDAKTRAGREIDRLLNSVAREQRAANQSGQPEKTSPDAESREDRFAFRFKANDEALRKL